LDSEPWPRVEKEEGPSISVGFFLVWVHYALINGTVEPVTASFGFKVILKYSVNTSISRKKEVSNTLQRLDLVNTSVLKTEVSSKTSFFLPNWRLQS
jgi:hypothetical protein